MTIVIIVIALAVVLIGAGAAFVTINRRGRGPELEPPREERAGGTTTLERPPPGEVDIAPPVVVEPEVEVVTEPLVKPSWRDRLTKARTLFSGYVGSILTRTKIDDETWLDLEEALIRADVGVRPATELLDSVRSRVKAEGL